MSSRVKNAPVTQGERITNLDAVRGWATLGILIMNVVSYGLPAAAYFNLDAGGSASTLDWIVGVLGEVFADQKMMGLFSLLFGAGVVLFADRTVAKGGRPVALSLWRNVLLFVIGFLHALMWDGDILIVYAGASVFVLALRNRQPRTLVAIGSAIFVLAITVGLAVSPTVSESGAELGDLWLVEPATDMTDAVGLWFLIEFGGRALGMMLIGVAMYRWGILDGTRDPAADRRMARWGFGIGLPLAVFAVVLAIVNGFDARWFLPTHALNTAATIPMVLGYVGVISLWNRRGDGWVQQRIRSVGRMALTNYLSQTVLGVFVLATLVDADELTRTGAFGFVLVVWMLQLAWSQPWLERFRFGPCEWVWRMCTYRRYQPLRRR